MVYCLTFKNKLWFIAQLLCPETSLNSNMQGMIRCSLSGMQTGSPSHSCQKWNPSPAWTSYTNRAVAGEPVGLHLCASQDSWQWQLCSSYRYFPFLPRFLFSFLPSFVSSKPLQIKSDKLLLETHPTLSALDAHIKATAHRRPALWRDAERESKNSLDRCLDM